MALCRRGAADVSVLATKEFVLVRRVSAEDEDETDCGRMRECRWILR